MRPFYARSIKLLQPKEFLVCISSIYTWILFYITPWLPTFVTNHSIPGYTLPGIFPAYMTLLKIYWLHRNLVFHYHLLVPKLSLNWSFHIFEATEVLRKSHSSIPSGTYISTLQCLIITISSYPSSLGIPLRPSSTHQTWNQGYPFLFELRNGT